MNVNLEESLRRIIGAVEFHSPQSFSFAGRPANLWSALQPPLGGTAPLGAEQIVPTLQNIFYATCYTRTFIESVKESPVAAAAGDDTWLASLSAANASKDTWEEGWTVRQFLPSGQIYAQKGNTTRAFWPGEFMSRGAYGFPPQAGTPIAAFFPRESRNSQPGFYFAFGETPAATDDEFPCVRYYWNLKREGGAQLIRSLTTALNRYQAPFRLKIVNSLALLNRTDSAVLYVGRRYYRIAAEITLETQAKVAAALDDAVPLFTLPLAKGLAFAEDPGNQESFGMSRCRLLAEGLWHAFCEGRSSVADRLERVRQHFLANGTSLERPYLNLASIDSYEFPQ